LTQSADSSVTAASGNLVISGSLDTAGYNLTFNGSSNTTVSGSISGSGAITKSGTGTTTLSASNTAANTTVDGGSLNVTGSLRNSDIFGVLTVGNTHSGATMLISAGGSVVADNLLYLGQSAGSDSNSITVTGTGSSLAVGNAWIGTADGAGNTGNTLEVSAGGSLTSVNVILGGSSNSVLVTGSNSTLTNSSGITVGEGSFFGGSSVGNSLVIANGGKVASAAVYHGAEFMIGYVPGDNQNSVTVTGAGSLLTHGGDVTVGYYGSSNSLVVSSGGTVANRDGFIGRQSTDNTALVTGVGSLWTNSGTLTVGGSPWSGAAGGTLTVASGGTVAAAGGITIATQAGDTGTLNIGHFGGNDAAGTIITPTIAFGAGTGVINFNQSDSTMVSAAISGNGSVNQLGTGTTTLSGINTYSGTTTVNAGTLMANNTGGSAVGTSAVTVSRSGTLGGNGTIGGATTIASGGTLMPGSGGVGALTFSNGLTLADGSTTTFLINGNNSFTSININGGNVQFGGALNLDITSSLTSGLFSLFNLSNGATESGNFSAVYLTGIYSGVMTYYDASWTWFWKSNSDYNGNQITAELNMETGALTVAAIPEPSTYALLGLGALGLLIAYRRKKAA
jgi:fibronectin-binding autotransporter adhesin